MNVNLKNMDVRINPTELLEIFSKLESGTDIGVFKNELLSLGKKNKYLPISEILEAANGDNRRLNDWMYNLSSSYTGYVTWIGKVKTENGSRYVWLIAKIDNEGQGQIRQLLDDAWDRISNDELFFNPQKRPPYITYLKSITTSEWQKHQNTSIVTNKIPQFGRIGMFVEGTALPHNKPLTPEHHEDINMSSDIEIFQVNYKKNGITEDIDQQMPLDSDYFIRKVDDLFNRVKLNCTEKVRSYYEQNVLPNASIITKLHAEIHNHGHFLGPVIYTQKDKNEETYEAIEEFRACLLASVVANHVDVDAEILTALPLHVFLIRYLGFGLDSYLSGKNDIVHVREMEVGALFYYMLGINRVLKVVNGKIDIDVSLLQETFRNEVKKIHNLEVEYRHLGKQGLSKIAQSYRAALFDIAPQKKLQSYYSKLIHS